MNDDYLKLRHYSDFQFKYNTQLIEAIQYLFNCYDENIIGKNSIDYSSHKKAYLDFINNRAIEELEYKELDIAQSLLEPLMLYEAYDANLKVIINNLQAIFFLVTQFDRATVRKQMNSLAYLDQHEILTRWMWLSEQHNGINKGERYEHPYLCRVGNNIKRKTIDREFHTYLVFAKYLSLENDSAFFLLRKSECPDFVITNETGNEYGLEITEAVPVKELMIERKKCDQLSEKIYKDFLNQNIIITLQTRPSWSILLKQYNELKEWLDSVIDNGQHELVHHNKELGISVYIQQSNSGFDLLDSSGDGSGLPIIGNKNELIITNFIINAIKNKLSKNYKKPCILAVYENTEYFDFQFDTVIKLCQETEEIQKQDVFNQIWIVKEKKSYMIYKNVL